MIAFGRFRLFPRRQMLFAGEERVPMGGTMFELLLVLTERPGELIGQHELMKRVWPGRIIDPCNVRSQVAALRRALGCSKGAERFIVTSSGRGYRFVAPVRVGEDAHRPSAAAPERPAVAQPWRAKTLIGREAQIAAAAERLLERRQLTILGQPGGGKSALAHAVASHVAGDFADGVHLVSPDADLPGRGLASSDREMLIVVDAAERNLDAVAALADTMLAELPRCALLVTSREALGSESETVLRVAALPVPAEDEADADAILDCAAVKLLRERMAHVRGDAAATSPAQLASLARRTGGNPLAIELVAAEAALIGAGTLLHALDDSLLLSLHRRAGSLRTTIESACAGLCEDTVTLLDRLGAVTGSFTLEIAARSAALEPGRVATLLRALAARSLVEIREAGDGIRYRLPEPVRAFAAERLRETGEHRGSIARLRRWLIECPDRIAREPVLHRALLAAGTEGEDFGALVLASVPAWRMGNRHAEADHWLDRSLAAANPVLRFSLLEACASFQAAGSGSAANLRRTGEAMLEAAQDGASRLAALRAVWVAQVATGGIDAARVTAAAARVEAARLGEPDRALADLMTSTVLHLEGRPREALDLVDRVIRLVPAGLADFAWPPLRTEALALRARLLLLLGRTDEASGAAAQAVEEARETGDPHALARVIALAALPVAISLARHPLAASLCERLTALSSDLALPRWRAVAELFQHWVSMAVEPSASAEAMEPSLRALAGSPIGMIRAWASTARAEAMVSGQTLFAAFDTVEAGLARASEGERWLRPEWMRIQALALARMGAHEGALALVELGRAEASTQGPWWLSRIDAAKAMLLAGRGGANDPGGSVVRLPRTTTANGRLSRPIAVRGAAPHRTPSTPAVLIQLAEG